MAKLRIYELAKELGMENKEMLELCVSLGMTTKSSHSNSLSDDEADKLRRTVLRRAVTGTRINDDKEVERSDGRFTERRLGGNVIRRRKKEDIAEEKRDEKIDLNEEVKTVDARAEESAHSQLEKDFETEKESRLQALRDADALFESKPEVAEPAPVVEDKKAQAPQPDATDVKSLEKDVQVEQQPSEATAAEALSPQEIETATHQVRLNEARARHDIKAPKILGKIVLPITTVVDKKDNEESKKSKKAESSKGKDKKGGKAKEAVLDDEPKYQKKKKRVIFQKEELLDFDADYDGWRGGVTKQRKKKKKNEEEKAPQPEVGEMRASKRVIKMQNEIIVSELAKNMQVKASEVIKKLMSLGTMASINQLIDFDTAEIVAGEFGYTITKVGDEEDELGIITQLKVQDAPEDLILRPPVVTIMGHVDHGKTSLLDAIRDSSVTSGEAGGITQHIGAYTVTTRSGGTVAFIDTPGHAAFTEMRGRGAKVTDIVVLVVAADDGIMPQTIEAINHAKAATVPIIVAVNKIDKPAANLDRVKQQLTEYDLIPEEWGGQTIVCPVSAKTKEGLDNLLDNLALQAEVLELKANPHRLAIGTVIESKVEKGRGPVVTVLVQSGTLKKGDAFIVGTTWGKVRAMHLHDGRAVVEASPSTPTEILGSESAPLAGEEFLVIKSEAEARRIAEIRQQRARLKELAHKSSNVGAPLTLDFFASMANNAEKKDLNLIVKADVQGSVEAVAQSLGRLGNEEVVVKIIHKAVGAVNENDVQLAIASHAIIIAFNIRADVNASEIAEREGVEIRYSRIIYELIESIEKAIKGLREPVFKENILGKTEVRNTFKVPKIGIIAGCYVTNGLIKRGALLRLLRDNVVVFEGKMSSLRRFKDDVKEVQTGYECGIGIDGYQDVKVGDVLEAYVMEQVEL